MSERDEKRQPQRAAGAAGGRARRAGD